MKLSDETLIQNIYMKMILINLENEKFIETQFTDDEIDFIKNLEKNLGGNKWKQM